MKNNLIKNIIVALLLLIILVFLVVIAVSYPTPFNRLSVDNDWINFYGNVVGGLLGAGVALLVFNLQFKNEKLHKNNRHEEFIDFFVNNHLAQIKKELNIYKEELGRSIDNHKIGTLIFDEFPLFYLSESNYTEMLHQISSNGKISREFCENYNKLFTRIKAINKLKESNIIENQMFLQSNLDYRVQKYSKHLLVRQMTDDKAFNQYLSRIIDK